jgi:hypothetical protein
MSGAVSSQDAGPDTVSTGEGGSGVGGTTGVGGTGGSGGTGGCGEGVATPETGCAGAIVAPGGSGGSGGTGGTNCTWANGGGDPSPGPLSCATEGADSGAHGPTFSLLDQVRATIEGSQIRLDFAYCGSCSSTNYLCVDRGGAENLHVAVEGSWATLVDQQPASSTCSDLVVHLLPSSGVIEGDVRVTGSFYGADQCHQPVSCPLDDLFKISQGDGGVLSVRAYQ